MAKASGSGRGGTTGNTSNPKIMWFSRDKPAERREVTSARMLPNSLYGSRFFIHRDLASPKDYWAISEYTTGLKIATGKTRNLALADFDVQIAKFREQASRGEGMEKEWRRMIRNAINRAGRANRG